MIGKTVTVTVDQTKTESYGYKTPNAGTIVGRIDAGDNVTVADNTENNVTVTVTVEETVDGPVVADVNGVTYSDIDDAFDNLREGCTVTIFAGTHYLNDSDEWHPRNVAFELPDNVTILGMEGAVIEREPKFIASGLTVKNVTFNGSGYVAMQIEEKGDVTFENLS